MSLSQRSWSLWDHRPSALRPKAQTDPDAANDNEETHSWTQLTGFKLTQDQQIPDQTEVTEAASSRWTSEAVIGACSDTRVRCRRRSEQDESSQQDTLRRMPLHRGHKGTTMEPSPSPGLY